MLKPKTRRGFLENLAWGAAALGFGRRASAVAASNAEMPRRSLGRTGVEVSCLGLGGYHLGDPKDEADAIRLVHSAVDRGITFLDNCWDYHEGDSERRVGRALQGGYRERVFLMSKIDGRTRVAASQQINESLQRLRTDHIDLMQFHEVIRPDDPERIFASGGAWEAMDAARKAGKAYGSTRCRCPSIHSTGTFEASNGRWFPRR
jgi:aryl-alcohol dehydrogenase-like predicted oxidoreductase